MEEEAFFRLQRVLAEVSGHPAGVITGESDLGLDLGLDSLKRVELATLLEEEFGVEVDDGLVVEVETVAGLLELLERGEKSSPALPFPRWALSRPACLLRSWVQRGLLFPALSLVSPVMVMGEENLAGLAPPFVIIANHNSHLDTPVILKAFPDGIRRRTAVAAAADYFYRNRLVGAMVSLLLNTFPFARTGPVRSSFLYCGELMDKGWSVLLYPEGTRSLTGELQPFKQGIGLLAKELRAPLVPIWVEGTRAILPKGNRIPVHGRVVLRIGGVVRIADDVSVKEAAGILEESLRKIGMVSVAAV